MFLFGYYILFSNFNFIIAHYLDAYLYRYTCTIYIYLRQLKFPFQLHYVNLYKVIYTFSYYHIADGVLCIYDVQNANTFTAVSKWLKEFKEANKNAEILIGIYRIFLCRFKHLDFSHTNWMKAIVLNNMSYTISI